MRDIFLIRAFTHYGKHTHMYKHVLYTHAIKIM